MFFPASWQSVAGRSSRHRYAVVFSSKHWRTEVALTTPLPSGPSVCSANFSRTWLFFFCNLIHMVRGFFMLSKAKGEPAKGHPVVRRLLSLRALLEDMSGLDEKMSSQVDLLLRALKSGVDLAGAGEGDEEEEDEEDEEEDGLGGTVGTNAPAAAAAAAATTNTSKARRVALSGGGGSREESRGEEEEGEDVDEEGLEEEEAMFMGGGGGGGGGGSSSGEEDSTERELSKAARKKRRRAALSEAKAKLAAGEWTGDATLADFGDEDVESSANAGGGGSGATLLQGMVNRISQRDQAAAARKGRGLQGDLDVPVRERDQTIRVRRPAPGEESDSEAGGSEDDFMGGGGGFMDGLPPGLLEGLSRRGGGDGDDAAGAKKMKKAAGKREHGDGGGEEDGEGGDFYAAVAEEKERKKRAKKEKYAPEGRIAGALEAELEAERAAKGETKRGASYTIIKNRGLTPHKNKLNRNPRSKKREAFRKATIRRKGQVRKNTRRPGMHTLPSLWFWQERVPQLAESPA